MLNINAIFIFITGKLLSMSLSIFKLIYYDVLLNIIEVSSRINTKNHLNESY